MFQSENTTEVQRFFRLLSISPSPPFPPRVQLRGADVLTCEKLPRWVRDLYGFRQTDALLIAGEKSFLWSSGKRAAPKPIRNWEFLQLFQESASFRKSAHYWNSLLALGGRTHSGTTVVKYWRPSRNNVSLRRFFLRSRVSSSPGKEPSQSSGVVDLSRIRDRSQSS